MKATITAIVLILISATATAEQTHCQKVAEVAEMTMKIRQAGVPMTKAIEAAKGSELVQKLVIHAYKSPAYQTEGYQKREVTNFTDQYFMACLEAGLTDA